MNNYSSKIRDHVIQFLGLLISMTVTFLGAAIAAVGLVYFHGGTEMVLRVWRGDTDIDLGLYYPIGAMLLGMLVGFCFGEQLRFAVVKAIAETSPQKGSHTAK